MWALCLVAAAAALSLLSPTESSKLSDLLATTEQFFGEMAESRPGNPSVDDIKLMVKRTYDESAGNRKLVRRSAGKEEPFPGRDDHGVYLLSNITDVATIPAKFPNDINILSFQNVLLIATLEANGTNPEAQLANDLVLYQYSPVQGITEVRRTAVRGGVKTTIHTYQDSIFIVAAEHEADPLPDAFEGSIIYRIIPNRKRVSLEKIQILNVIEPNDVQFWEHQDQLYLMVGTNMGNDSLRSGTLVYRWMGQHFDCIQRIASKHVRSLAPFSVGSFMYLAVADYQDEHGDTDIDSNIYQFHLDDMKFHLFQSVRTHGAHHVSHFKFESEDLTKSEHFVVFANYMGRNEKGALTTYLDSVVYKFNGNLFVPFQSFKLLGATKWLPVQGSRGEFLLLATHSNGVRGYQYDGWRFSQVSLKFDQSPLGDNIQSLRAFQYFNDILLTIADKNSYGENVNLWKLSFTNRNDLEEEYGAIESWCEGLTLQSDRDNITDLLNGMKRKMVEVEPDAEAMMKSENLKLDDSEVLRTRIEKLLDDAFRLSEALKKIGEKAESLKEETEVPIVLGSREIPRLEIKCNSTDCLRFRNLNVNELNGENLGEFLRNVVSIDDDITDAELSFDRVSVSGDLSAGHVIGHPAATLVDAAAETFVNSRLVVRGRILVNGELRVHGHLDGVPPDPEHLLTYEGDQVIDGSLVANEITVGNLEMSGDLNGRPLEDLTRKPEVEMDSQLKELNVNNLIVGGLVNGYNLSEVLSRAVRKTGDGEFQVGELDVDVLEAEEVLVDSNEVSNMTVQELLLSHPCLGRAEGKGEGARAKWRNGPEEYQRVGNEEEEPEVNIIVVSGRLRAEDIAANEPGFPSLKDILDNSYRLDESVIGDPFVLGRVEANETLVEFINNIPVNSWVLRDSEGVQVITGRKVFLGDVRVTGKVSAGVVNGIDLEELAASAMTLDTDQTIPGNFTFERITSRGALQVTSMIFGNGSSNQLDRLTLSTSVHAETFEGGDLIVEGTTDNIRFGDMLKDSVFSPADVVANETTIVGTLHVDNLNLSGRINDLFFDELLQLNSKTGNTIVLDRDVALDNSLAVNELEFEGTINSVLEPDFAESWLLQDAKQTIGAPFVFAGDVHLKSGAVLKNDTVNTTNLKRLFSRSIRIDEDVRIRHLYAMDRIEGERIDVGGTVNGADFAGSVVRRKGAGMQEMSGEWFLEKGLEVRGSLVVEGYLSGMNMSRVCSGEGIEAKTDKINVIVEGSVFFESEPRILSEVNGVNLLEKSKEVWMGNENTTLSGGATRLERVSFKDRTSLSGNLNGFNLSHVSRFYLSRSGPNRVVSADVEFDRIIIEGSCRMRRALVGGLVNGVNITRWAKNVLLQGEDQEIRGELRFSTFEADDLALNGTVNGEDLCLGVLRRDVDGALVEGEKTFMGIEVEDLFIAPGKKIQGVDVDDWRRKMVTRGGDSVLRGNVVIRNAEFYGPVTVLGKVNGVRFDSSHLLLKTGNQVVSARKHFNVKERGPGAFVRMKRLQANGLIGGLDHEYLLAHQAYSDRDLVFTEPQTFVHGLAAGVADVDGLFQGVNVTETCLDAFHPADVDKMKNGFAMLSSKAAVIERVIQGRAFYFDYFELIQTLKPDVKAVVPTIEGGEYFLTVVTVNAMKLMAWNEYAESFTGTGESLHLKDNITFVTSEITGNDSLLFIEGAASTRVFKSDRMQELEGGDTSCVASFRLEPINKTCLFIGQKWNSSRIVCESLIMDDLRTYQWLESRGSVQATVLTIRNDVYLAVINKEQVVDKIENSLTIYRFDPRLQHFHETQTFAEVNPVAVSSVSYRGNHYLASAGGHLPESVHNSVLSIFRFNKAHRVFVRYKSIQVDTPVDVRFALLPTSELALYVLTSNPTKPFLAFLYRGIAGFAEETSGLSLYPGSSLHSFTDPWGRHFVVVSGFGRGQILRAGFKGDKMAAAARG